MLHIFLKYKAVMTALSVKLVLVAVPIGLMTGLTAQTVRAASLTSERTWVLLQAQSTLQCYPVPQQGGGSGSGGLPTVSINPVDWIGWVLGELCKSVATVFFTLTNQVINWGSGCSKAGINFVTQTPNYIRLDAGKADNWQFFFWDGRFIGAALLLQFSWMAFSIIWNRQLGHGYAGAQEALTRAFLGGISLLISGALMEWAVSFCNLLNDLFAARLSLFEPQSLQVDANGNIFNTVLAMAAALASLLLVMQMATRYIYLILLQFIFPVGSLMWINRGTQGYARLLFGSFIASLFVQPLQLAVIYITSNLKDGTRDDTSLSMLFGICGLFLALGLPRVMGSVLGGGTPVGAWGVIAIGRMAAGGLGGAVRAGSRGGGSNGNGNGSGNNAGSGGRPSGGGGSGNGGGNERGAGNNPSRTPTLSGMSGAGRSSSGPNQSSESATGESATGADESLRYGGGGHSTLRNASASKRPTTSQQGSSGYQEAGSSNFGPVTPYSPQAQEDAGITASPSTQGVGSAATIRPTAQGNEGITQGQPSASGAGRSNLRGGPQSDPSSGVVSQPGQGNIGGGGSDKTQANQSSRASSPLTGGQSPSNAASDNNQAVRPATIYRNRHGLMAQGATNKGANASGSSAAAQPQSETNTPTNTGSNTSLNPVSNTASSFTSLGNPEERTSLRISHNRGGGGHGTGTHRSKTNKAKRSEEK